MTKFSIWLATAIITSIIALNVVNGSDHYSYLPYFAVVKKLQKLRDDYPEIIDLVSAQERYKLPSSGDCSQDNLNLECNHWFVRITNHTTWKNDPERAQIFLSGNLHGDEQIGPMAVLAYIEEFVQKAMQEHDSWFLHLLNSRVIVAIPITNPYGYVQNQREDITGDPNRDFPYDVGQGASCMKTVVARAINEIFREHLFQSAITFHGGVHSITYEWGAPNHKGHDSTSPDHSSQSNIAIAMQQYAGAYQNQLYEIGTMNSIVYPVKGGMEDWSYAGSWDVDNVPTCHPGESDQIGDYTTSKTMYDDTQLRCSTFLVETWSEKKPSANQLGSNDALLTISGKGDGHVPRNLRLALLITDIVEPYVLMTGVPHLTFHKTLRSDPRRIYDDSSMQALRSDTPFRRLSSACTAPDKSDAVTEAQTQLTSAALRMVFPTFRDSSKNTLLVRNTPELSTEYTLSAEMEWSVGGCLKVDGTRTVVIEWDPLVDPSILSNSASITSDHIVSHINTDLVEILSRNVSHLSVVAAEELRQIIQGRLHLPHHASGHDENWPIVGTHDSSGSQKQMPSVVTTKMVRSVSNVFKGNCGWNNLHSGSDMQLSTFKDTLCINSQGAPFTSERYLSSDTSDDLSVVLQLPNYGNFSVRTFLAFAAVVTDQDWGNNVDSDPVSTLPQSHLARVRTDYAWRKKNTESGFIARGRTHFGSKLQQIWVVDRISDYEAPQGGSENDAHDTLVNDATKALLTKVNVLIVVIVISYAMFCIGCCRLRRHEQLLLLQNSASARDRHMMPKSRSSCSIWRFVDAILARFSPVVRQRRAMELINKNDVISHTPPQRSASRGSKFHERTKFTSKENDEESLVNNMEIDGASSLASIDHDHTRASSPALSEIEFDA